VGFTSGNYFDINLTTASQVPQNTLFTGILMIQDPNDSTFLCGLPFSFLYGNQLASVSELTENQLSIFPNPSSGFVHINTKEEDGTIRVIDQFGRIYIATELKSGQTCFHLQEEGIYFIQVSSKQGQSTQKVIVHE
jgi:hypothetical protein